MGDREFYVFLAVISFGVLAPTVPLVMYIFVGWRVKANEIFDA
jgi:hypothetical protein